MYRLLESLVPLNLSTADFAACFQVGAVGLRCNIESCQQQSLKLLADLVTKHPQEIGQTSEAVLVMAIDLMKSRDSTIHADALRFVSQCFSTDEPHLIDIALSRDVLGNFEDLLCSTSTKTIRETLWGLSNITASIEAHVNAFLSAESLFERVLTLTCNSNHDI